MSFIDPGCFGLSPNTVLLTANGTSSAVSVPNAVGRVSTRSMRIRNTSLTVEVFVAIATKAAPTAVIPTAGSPAYGMALAPNSIEVFDMPADCYVAGITSGGTALVYITPGEGS